MDLLDDETLIDLRRRAKATDPAAVLAEERQRRHAANPQPMAVPEAPTPEPVAAGICALCKTRPSRGHCVQCGRAACAADLWVMLRLCRTCASDDDVERGQRGRREGARNWAERQP